MATQTQKLIKDQITAEEKPKKTLETSDPPVEESLNDLEQLSPMQGSSSSGDDVGLDDSRKEGEKLKAGEALAPQAATEASAISSAADNAPVSHVEKKMRRAERFGMPVQLSEEEKRNTRAERFGTRSSVHVSGESKNAEEQKRKARAERFGIPVPLGPDEEATKKKARQARFAPISKTDPAEEDKKKARAIRFSQTPNSAPVNGKENIEAEPAIAGKVGGGA